MPRTELPTNATLDGRSRPAVAVSRLASGGLSVVVALALAVNLTCRAAGPVIESFRDGTTERSALRHLTLAIHRVVRRWIRGDGRRRGEAVRHDGHRYGRAKRRAGAGLAVQRRWFVGRRLLVHLIDLPPPALA